MKYLHFWILFLGLATASFAAEKVGRVSALDGALKAIDSDQVERMLQRHSDVFLGDTLITDEGSKGEIEFLDKTIVLLIPGSEYTIETYSSDQYAARLSQGGARVSTGLIAKKNPENFIVNTPNATIGVRGTVFETRIYQGDTYYGSSSGGISVRNSGGQVDLGSGQRSNYAWSSSEGSAPQLLGQRPAALDLSLFSPPTGMGLSPTASGAAAGSAAASRGLAWGVAAGSVVVLGAIVGVVAATASESSSVSSTSHAHGH